MRFVATSADIVLLKEAINLWGLSGQVYKTIEETSELNIELARGLVAGGPDCDKLADEIADVHIMLHSLAYGFGINETVDTRVDFKMNRLELLVRRGCPAID